MLMVLHLVDLYVAAEPLADAMMLCIHTIGNHFPYLIS